MFDDVRQLGGQAGLRQSKGKLVTVACLEDLLESPFTAVFPGLCACYSFFWGGGNLLNSSSSYKGLAMSGGRAKTCQNCGRGCKGHHLKNHASIPGSATTLSGHETLYSLIFLVLYVFVFFLASFPGEKHLRFVTFSGGVNSFMLKWRPHISRKHRSSSPVLQPHLSQQHVCRLFWCARMRIKLSGNFASPVAKKGSDIRSSNISNISKCLQSHHSPLVASAHSTAKNDA